MLRPLSSDDAADYSALLRRNTGHLGPGYAEEIGASDTQHASSFARNPDPPVKFAIIADGRLIGRIDLVPVNPPRFGLGYWVSQDHAGQGIATAAIAAIIDYARQSLAATDVYAGVSHGNTASQRALERNGFAVVQVFGTYSRFHRALTS